MAGVCVQKDKYGSGESTSLFTTGKNVNI